MNKIDIPTYIQQKIVVTHRITNIIFFHDENTYRVITKNAPAYIFLI
jgi:hypothetical protein